MPSSRQRKCTRLCLSSRPHSCNGTRQKVEIVFIIENSILTSMCLGTYEGYTYDLMEEIKKILE